MINKSFDFGIEKYKSTLELQLEEYKSELMKFNYEHQIKFNKLHEERGEKIRSIYTKTIEVEHTLFQLTTPAQGPEFIDDVSRDNAAINSTNQLAVELEYNKIYFTDETIEKINSLIMQSFQIISDMRTAKIYRKGIIEHKERNETPPEHYFIKGELWDSAYKKTQNEFKILKAILINDFRTILGI